MVRRGRKKVALLHKHTALVSSSTKPGVTINMKDLKMNMAMSTPIINNGLTRSRLASKTRCNGKVAGDKVKGDAYSNGLTAEESDSENSSVYHEPYKLLPSTKQEYGCLLKRDALSSSKSAEYTGECRWLWNLCGTFRLPFSFFIFLDRVPRWIY